MKSHKNTLRRDNIDSAWEVKFSGYLERKKSKWNKIILKERKKIGTEQKYSERNGKFKYVYPSYPVDDYYHDWYIKYR